jgi:hypothetical protein
LKLIAFALVLLLPALALACPACAGRNDGFNTFYLLGSMILLPFGVAGVVYRVLKRVAQEESAAGETRT